MTNLELGDLFELVAIYHKDIGGPEPDPTRPGVVKNIKTGELYVIEPV